MQYSTPTFIHPEYTEHQRQLKIVNDMFSGIDTAKYYIQKYSQESTSDYDDRKEIATLDNFVFRTIEDIKNIIFRKSIDETNVTNNTMLKYIEQIDFQIDLNEFAKRVLVNRIKDGYTFILADSIRYDDTLLSNNAQKDAYNIRPYLVNILRENVLNWQLDEVGNYTQITIREFYQEKSGYATLTFEQLKVWNVDGTVEIWRKGELVDIWDTGIKTIPIVKIGKDLIPPLYDMAKLNITHMNRNSEVDIYTRVGGAPFLAVFGHQDQKGAQKTLGINKGLSFSDKSQSDVKWIEMDGKNYDMLKDRILYIEDQMKRIAVDFTTKIETIKTATQVNKESMSGESKATDYAIQLEMGINQALAMMNLYEELGVNEIEVNTDFDSSILSPDMVASYRLDVASELLSRDKFIEIMIAGEYFPYMTPEEIETEKARLSNMGG